MTKTHAGLDRNQPLPLYFQVYQTLRSQLMDGIWTAGDLLPPLPELAKRFNVSIVTIRQAIDLLSKDGLVVSQRGRGTSVTAKQTQNKPLHLESTFGELLKLYEDDSPELEPLDEGISSPLLPAIDVVIPPSFYYISRAHVRDKIRYCLITLYLEEGLFRENEDAFRNQLALPVLFAIDGLELGRAWQTLQIEKADHRVANFLNIQLGDPIARVRRYITDKNDKLIYCADVHYRHDCIQYMMELNI